eukprot:CAMPEP_0202693306 /NCGR_PEP_ID=MMETSP1385-20130828/7459_1 /ASSEMBLY_ACC=CAM_ASM_000861 /TAXON_ID=933848 /ORGANISM="Elphidium margaritaceum" /LENGTH=499 /DNA_ID=CAMNT_0049348967 /DNA_START=31 /DNA_END=1530 /DNA_ORIENTATION=+
MAMQVEYENNPNVICLNDAVVLHSNRKGIVRYISDKSQDRVAVGIELTEPNATKFADIDKLFKCKPYYGILVKLTQIARKIMPEELLSQIQFLTDKMNKYKKQMDDLREKLVLNENQYSTWMTTQFLSSTPPKTRVHRHHAHPSSQHHAPHPHQQPQHQQPQHQQHASHASLAHAHSHHHHGNSGNTVHRHRDYVSQRSGSNQPPSAPPPPPRKPYIVSDDLSQRGPSSQHAADYEHASPCSPRRDRDRTAGKNDVRYDAHHHQQAPHSYSRSYPHPLLPPQHDHDFVDFIPNALANVTNVANGAVVEGSVKLNRDRKGGGHHPPHGGHAHNVSRSLQLENSQCIHSIQMQQYDADSHDDETEQHQVYEVRRKRKLKSQPSAPLPSTTHGAQQMQVMQSTEPQPLMNSPVSKSRLSSNASAPRNVKNQRKDKHRKKPSNKQRLSDTTNTTLTTDTTQLTQISTINTTPSLANTREAKTSNDQNHNDEHAMMALMEYEEV